MRSIVRGIVLVSLALVFSAIAGEEKEIPLKEVPKKVLAAAQEAAPGIVLEEAEVEQTEKGLVYELEGKVGEKEYELHIAADGKVLKIEDDDDDDDDDDDHDHDDHHEHKDDD